MIRRVVVAFTFAVRLRSRAKALHPDMRNTPDPLYISYIDFSISDTYSEFTKGMEPRLPPEFIKRIRQGGPMICPSPEPSRKNSIEQNNYIYTSSMNLENTRPSFYFFYLPTQRLRQK